MKIARVRVGLLVVVLGLAVALRALMGAMEQPRAAGIAAIQATGAEAYIPEAAALGEGWYQVGGGVPPADPAVFLDSARAHYAGPLGANVILHAYRAVPGRAAVVRSWEDVGAVFDDLRYGMGMYGPAQRVDVPPAPCVDATRIVGMEDTWTIPVGITMCALEPDIILLVAVGGMWSGMTGVGASDGVTQVVARIGLGLEGTPGAFPATPVAIPRGTPVVSAGATPQPEGVASTPEEVSADGDESGSIFAELDGITDGAYREYRAASPGFFSVVFYGFLVLAFESPTTAEAGMEQLSERFLTPPTDPEGTDFSTLRPVSFPDAKDGVIALGGEIDVEDISASYAVVLVRDGRFVFGFLAGGLGADVFAEMDTFVAALPDDPEAVEDDLFAVLPALDDMPPGFVLESDERIR